MKYIQCIINDILLLTEANIANAGKNEIVIKDSDGNEVDIIHSLDKIIKKFLSQNVFQARTPPEVKKWFESNFYNWIKKGAPDQSNLMMDDELFRKIFYVPLNEYINQLLRHESELVQEGKLSQEVVLDSFPDFVKNNPNDIVIFSGGRLFRLKKIIPALQAVQDYLTAVQQNKQERNDTIMPPDFMIKRFDVLTVPEAFRHSNAWHNYTERMQEKVDREQALQMVRGLKEGTDYKIIQEFPSGATMVQLVSGEAAKVEGTIMKHCVGSYHHDIEMGRTTIYSLRDSEGLPQATIELKGNKAVQVKGRNNSTVKPEHHDELRQFFKQNKISVGADAKNFGGMSKGEQ